MKKEYIYTICIALSVFLLEACSPTTLVGENIGVTETPMRIGDYYSQSNIIPLEEDSSMVLGGASIIHYNKGLYYLLDDKYEQIISFDELGKPIDRFLKKGNASDEYIRILDFDVEDNHVYVLCYPNKILELDNRLNFIKKIDVPKGSTRIALREKQLYTYCGSDRSISTLNRGRWEKLLEEGYLPACPKVGSPVFFKTKNKMYYCSEGGNNIYEISRKGINPFFSMEYQNRLEIEERLEKKKPLAYEERISMSPPSIRSIIENTSSLLITYSFKGLYRACTIDLESKSIIQDGYWEGKYPFPKTQIGNGCFSTSFVSSEDIPIDSSYIKIKYMNDVQENGNLSIVKYQ